MCTESDRDPPRERALTVRVPGHLVGRRLEPAAVLPGAGPLELRIDGDVALTVNVDHGAETGQPIDDERGRRTAARIQGAVRAGAATVAGQPVVDPERLTELAAVTVRWDRPRRRLVISSGRRGAIAPDAAGALPPSAVALGQATAQASALGLDSGAVAVPARVVRHRVPAPRAMAFDVRVDLWAGSQRQLAAIVAQWAQSTPTRGQLLLRPGVLAADVLDGATRVELQPGGEPAGPTTLARYEPVEGQFTDHLSGSRLALRGAGTVGADGLTLPAGATATGRLADPPAVPEVLTPAELAPAGWGATVALRLSAGAAGGNHAPVLRLVGADGVALAIELEIVEDEPGPPPVLVGRLRCTAEAAGGTPFAPVEVDVPLSLLEAGVEVHAVADAARGATAVYLDGVMAGSGPPGPPRSPAGSAGEAGLELTLGGGPLGMAVGPVGIHTASTGPRDPRLRAAAATPARFAVGDPFALVRSRDGFTGQGAPFTALVAAIDGDTVVLDRAVVGTWPRASTLVHSRPVFFAQTQVRRRDDLANNLYRLSLDYRVSGYLDTAGTAERTGIVETVDAQVRPLSPDGQAPARTTPGTPGPVASIRNWGAP
jgi:hypothetical protein